MRTKWYKWLYQNFDMIVRHIGTAGMGAGLGTWIVEGKVNWKVMGAGLVAGTIVPTVFSILQKGLPPLEEESTKITIETTKTIAPDLEKP